MSAGAWTAVAAIIAIVGTAITVAGGIFTARAGRKASPYDMLAERVTVLEEQRVKDIEKIEAQHEEIVQLKDGRAGDQREIATLQRTVAGVIDDRDDLVRYIGVFRAWVSAGAKPPAPIVPEHLADVLPQWVPVVGPGIEPE